MAASKSSAATARSASDFATLDRLRQRLLLVLLIKLRIGRAGIFALILLLFDADDVGRALEAGEQIFSILGVEEFAERFDAADDEKKIVLAFKCKDGINQIVPRALVAQLNFRRSAKKTRRS